MREWDLETYLRRGLEELKVRRRRRGPPSRRGDRRDKDRLFASSGLRETQRYYYQVDGISRLASGPFRGATASYLDFYLWLSRFVSQFGLVVARQITLDHCCIHTRVPLSKFGADASRDARQHEIWIRGVFQM